MSSLLLQRQTSAWTFPGTPYGRAPTAVAGERGRGADAQQPQAKPTDTTGFDLDEAQRARQELEKPLKVSFDTKTESVSFMRASIRREADREVREAR
jgi:hypothetical protein